MSSYSPERFQELFSRVARPFKPALLERSLALLGIVRLPASPSLESEPGAKPDQDDPGEPGHEMPDAGAQPAAAQPADDVPVSDQPGEQHHLEGRDHEDEPDRGVARDDELRHHGDEEGPGLRIQQVAEKTLAPGASISQCCSRNVRIRRCPRQQTAKTEVREVYRAGQLEDREGRRRTFEEHADPKRCGRGPGEDASRDAQSRHLRRAWARCERVADDQRYIWTRSRDE